MPFDEIYSIHRLTDLNNTGCSTKSVISTPLAVRSTPLSFDPMLLALVPPFEPVSPFEPASAAANAVSALSGPVSMDPGPVSTGPVAGSQDDVGMTESYNESQPIEDGEVQTGRKRKSVVWEHWIRDKKEKLTPMTDSFDILSWWRISGPQYPILSKMARDILAIPTSSVASESSFSRARRIITDNRSSLHSETVERLMCTKDWLPDLTIENFKASEEMVEDVGIDAPECSEEWMLDPDFDV